MLQRKIFAGIGLALLLGSSPVYAAPFPSLANDVGVCDPNNPSHCIAPDASGNVPITGTITASLGGFTPSASGARGTPLSVTTSDSSGTLPTGAVTIVSNAGTTNPMYCNVNGVAATTSDQLIGANSWFAFTIPAAITTLHCIATGGTTTANMLGGAGLATGAGGGSGGSGGGGAITAASGSYASGALSSGSVASGAYASGSVGSGAMVDLGAIADAAATAGSTGTLSAKLRLMTTQLGTINTTLNAPFQAGGSIGNTTFAVTQATAASLNATVVPSTLAAWGLVASTQNGATPTNGQLAMAQFNTTPTTVTTGNVSPLQMDNAGNLLVNIKTGASSGAVAQGSTTSGQTGLLIQGAVTTAAPSYTTAQTSPLSLDTAGNLRVNVTNTNANGQALAANSSPVVLPVAQVTADPCSLGAKTNLPISQNGTASVQLVALSGATSIYVCSLSLIAAGATTVALTTGTGSACVTGNAAVIGTTTASIANSMSLAANGGLTLGNGAGTIAKGAASSELCMVLGTSVFVSGNLTYVQL